MPRHRKRAGETQRSMGSPPYPRVPVASILENLEYGSTIEEIVEQYDVAREQIRAVLEFAARSVDAPPVPVGAASMPDAHPL